MTDCRSCDQGWHNKSYWVYLLFHIVGFHCFFHDHLKSVFCIFLAYPWLMLFLNDLQKVSVTCKKWQAPSYFNFLNCSYASVCSMQRPSLGKPHYEEISEEITCMVCWLYRWWSRLTLVWTHQPSDDRHSLHHSQLELTVHHSVHSIFCFSFWHYFTLNIEVKWHSWESGAKQNGDLILTC